MAAHKIVQICPWDPLACCWDVKQPRNQQTAREHGLGLVAAVLGAVSRFSPLLLRPLSMVHPTCLSVVVCFCLHEVLTEVQSWQDSWVAWSNTHVPVGNLVHCPPKSSLYMFRVLLWSVSLINYLQCHRCGWSFRKTSQEWVDLCKREKEKHKHGWITERQTHTIVHTCNNVHTHTHTHTATCACTHSFRERERCDWVFLVDLSFYWLALGHLMF